MNVAILGAEQPSQIVADIIEQHYNSWIEQRLGEKLNVVAYVAGGGRQDAKYRKYSCFEYRTICAAVSQKIN